jgi:hypothetical protein
MVVVVVVVVREGIIIIIIINDIFHYISCYCSSVLIIYILIKSLFFSVDKRPFRT